MVVKTSKHEIKNRPVLVFAGPTAAGKSALCHRVASRMQASDQRVVILNLDAFQMARGFDVGTAKPSPAERSCYDYRFIDVCEPQDVPDAFSFGREAREVIAQEQQSGARILAVGGSGLYMRSLIHGLDELPARHDELREFFRTTAAFQGTEALHRWLQRLDPVRAAKIHPNDLVRIERALEIFFVTGQTTAAQATRQASVRHQKRLFDAYVVAVIPPLPDLERRIRERASALIGHETEGPWIAEVRRLLQRYGSEFLGLQATRALGYGDIARAVLDAAPGSLSPQTLATLVSQVVTKTRQYAKRQTTWLGSAAVDCTVTSAEEQLAFVEQFS